MKYSDFELLEYLRENHYIPSYENLCILKEGIETGAITLEEKKEEEVVALVTKEKDKKEEKIEEPTSIVTVSVENDGNITITSDKKEVIADKSGNVVLSLSENHINHLLKSYLLEDCGLDEEEYNLLTEDSKIDSVKNLAVSLFKSIEEKIVNIDTSCADRSRGNIKALDILPALQDALTKFEAMAERDENGPKYMTAINTIIKSILYLNQYSSIFKEAYRNKKTVMILKYQSIILSIISSISYMISSIVDFSNNGVQLKNTNIDLMEFAPMKTLSEFIRSVDSGEFKIVNKDVSIMREYYLEIPVETMSTVLEANNYIDMIVGGVKNLYSTLSNNSDKLTGLLYKAAGVIVLLFSLRDVFYTLYNMRTKVSDMIGSIQNFAGLNNGGNILNKLSQFASKFKTDAEYGSDISKREVESENRKFGNQIRSIQNSNKIEIVNKPEELPASETTNTFGQQPAVDNNDFIFDF